MAESVFLRRLSRWQAEQQRESVADLYVEARRGAVGEALRDRQDFLRRFADDVRLPAFDMVVAGAAGSSGATVGCACGFRLGREDEHWQRLGAGRPAAMEELTAAGRGVALAELMVLASHRRRG